ncbi:MAG: ATP-dependent Clp protease adapter ClpS [Opitutales bacterium]|nr:ATP-dependent Clp protease adapter ClpS [Opitutales bacterium]
MPVTEPETKTEAKTSLQPPWKVIVMNDPVNLMSYVVLVFRKVFGFDEPKARKHMLEVHEQGRSVLWAGPREVAENYVYQLHQWQLNAYLEKDEEN